MNIGLVEEGRSILGVVFCPSSGACYFAAQGQGAWRQQGGGEPEPIQVSAYDPTHPRMVASRSHAGAAVTAFRSALAAKSGSDPAIVSMGSALKVCVVAEGNADVYPRLAPTSEWDTCASHCVLTEAGGRLVDCDGAELCFTDYDGDGICDEVDVDVDGNGWNDSYQCQCSGLEDSDAWSRESVFSSSGTPSSSIDSAQYGYDFQLSRHGLRYYAAYYNDGLYQWLQRHDSSMYGAQNAHYDADDYNYWDIESQNGINYLAHQRGVIRLSEANGSMSTAGTGISHAQTTSSDIAISREGDMVVR